MSENSRPVRIWKVALDVTILIALGLPILVLYITGEAKWRGFYCNDYSIKYPYRDSTVSNTALYLYGFLIPGLAIVGVEYYNFKKRSSSSLSYYFRNIVVSPYLVELYKKFGVFLYGAAFSQLLTDVAKYSVGRLRPHFLYICDPSIDCTRVAYSNMYVQDYRCEGDDEHRIKESRLSFFSGHASFSAYSLIFFVLYLELRLRVRGWRFPKACVEFLALLLAFWVSLTRVYDFKHHPGDVAAGFLSGTIVAVLVVFFVSDFYERRGVVNKAFQDEEKNIESNNVL